MEFIAFRCDECTLRRECRIEDEEECEKNFSDRYGRSKYVKIIKDDDVAARDGAAERKVRQ